MFFFVDNSAFNRYLCNWINLHIWHNSYIFQLKFVVLLNLKEEYRAATITKLLINFMINGLIVLTIQWKKKSSSQFCRAQNYHLYHCFVGATNSPKVQSSKTHLLSSLIRKGAKHYIYLAGTSKCWKIFNFLLINSSIKWLNITALEYYVLLQLRLCFYNN